MKQTIEEKVRVLGDGTAHTELNPCAYIRQCNDYTPACKPDNCKYIDKFYALIRRP